ncbi:hypothetical protein EX30DRAFT_341507 [Ascodesmis nigricans]|uniref:EamA domain-containing protein n=1 Tax=Ascodesmis nigricans TaxID=341454 RepID=A0A4V3SIK9_9PEZI|nr:hypothetical protein EX30DRAFT_341507 [Ascodesmis nigricans]
MAALSSSGSAPSRPRFPTTSALTDSLDSISTLDSSSPSTPLLAPTIPKPRPITYNREKKRESMSPQARRSIGLLFLAVVVFSWVFSSFLTFAIFSDDSYSKPYFMTYLNTCSFSLYLIPVGVRHWWQKRCEHKRGGRYQQLPTITDSSNGAGVDEPLHSPPPPLKLTNMETLRLSAQFCLLWFIANYLGSYCLAFTSVASYTILSATSGIFTLFLGVLLSHTRFTIPKLTAVLLSFLGISLIANIDLHPTPANTPTSSRTPYEVFLGDLMALLSAFGYAAYITLLKHKTGDDDEARVDYTLFFGFVGALNALFLWPGLIILHKTGIEPFELPPNSQVWAILLINAAITLVSDMCWAWAVLFTSPLVTTLGLGATIPVAMVGEMVVLGVIAGIWYWVGAVLVLAGFVIVNWEDGVEKKEVMRVREEEEIDQFLNA